MGEEVRAIGVVVYWQETSPFGPSLEFLCAVEDMGGARALSRAAEAMNAPRKEDRLKARHPLAEIALRHPGELLWRVLPEDRRPSLDPDEPPWAIGAEAARDLRHADVDRFWTTIEAAQERRKSRRHGR